MRSSSSQAALRKILSKELSEIQAAGTFKKERVITTPQAASIHVQEREGDLLNFCANNYLGLSVRLSGWVWLQRGAKHGQLINRLLFTLINSSISSLKYIPI